MDYRILMTDTLHSGKQELMKMPVWRECGFIFAGKSTDVKNTVQAADNQDFDVILCIHRPGDAESVELLTALKKKGLTIPVLILSSQEDAECMRQCFLLGCVDFMTEPLTEHDIHTSLVRVSKHLSEQYKNQEYATALQKSLHQLQENGVQESVIEKLQDFYQHSGNDTVTTETAAEYFGFNKDYFCRYFKLRTGLTFSEFHKGVQMEYAKLLLLTGHFKVQDVSDMLGFSTADYFTRAFKKRIGKTPSEFKKS